MFVPRSVSALALLGLAGGAPLAGCAGGSHADFVSASTESPTVARLRGDWDDLEASLLVAASKAEMAVVDVGESGTDRFRAELTTPGDQAVRLDVVRVPGAPDRFEARCRLEPFGDATAERRLLAALSRRLGQLHGRDWAPVR